MSSCSTLTAIRKLISNIYSETLMVVVVVVIKELEASIHKNIR